VMPRVSISRVVGVVAGAVIAGPPQCEPNQSA
jgi:hypothetical protein